MILHWKEKWNRWQFPRSVFTSDLVWIFLSHKMMDLCFPWRKRVTWARWAGENCNQSPEGPFDIQGQLLSSSTETQCNTAAEIMSCSLVLRVGLFAAFLIVCCFLCCLKIKGLFVGFYLKMIIKRGNLLLASTDCSVCGTFFQIRISFVDHKSQIRKEKKIFSLVLFWRTNFVGIKNGFS